MTLNDRQSPNVGILMVVGGILHMGLGLVGMQHNQELAALFLGGHYFLGVPITQLDAFKSLAVTVQSGFVLLLGAVVSVAGVVIGLKTLQPAAPQAPTLSR
jgi:hypothetical protein